MEILIPSTFGSDERDKRLQVQKIGRILRACAIFGVDQITIYKDEDPKTDDKRNSEFLERNLKYGACPPYMRKELFPRHEDLKYASILPPLRIPSHGYSKGKDQENLREAVVKEKRGSKAILNAGLDHEVTTQGLMKGERVTVRIKEGKSCEVLENVKGFWNIEVENKRDKIKDLLEERKEKTLIGTSRKGKDVRDYKKEIKSLNFDETVLAFGSAWRGLYELSEREKFSMKIFDHVLNTVPDQNTQTVRTEEAVLVTLGIFNLWR